MVNREVQKPVDRVSDYRAVHAFEESFEPLVLDDVSDNLAHVLVLAMDTLRPHID